MRNQDDIAAENTQDASAASAVAQEEDSDDASGKEKPEAQQDTRPAGVSLFGE